MDERISVRVLPVIKYLSLHHIFWEWEKIRGGYMTPRTLL